MTTIIAGSGHAIFAVHHFQRVSPLSLFANLAVMPIVTIVMFLRRPRRLGNAFRPRRPFLYHDGQGPDGDDRNFGMDLGAFAGRCSRPDSLQSVLLVTVALVVATMATTWLRLAALPFALAGLLTISEDAHPRRARSRRMRIWCACRLGGGELAVEPGAFERFHHRQLETCAGFNDDRRAGDIRKRRCAVRHRRPGRPAAGSAFHSALPACAWPGIRPARSSRSPTTAKPRGRPVPLRI